MDPNDFLKQLNDLRSGKPEVDQELLLEMMSSMFQGCDFSLSGLVAGHPNLCEQLSNFSLFSALRLIGGLETVPELQKHGVRIGVLLHLAYVSCRGSQTATTSDLIYWLTYLNQSPTASQEDPPEDVFIGYVCGSEGGFRVFPGIISHADFVLERLLKLLDGKQDFPPFKNAVESLVALLKLSEEIANRLDLRRYFSIEWVPSNDLSFPAERKPEDHAAAITFSQRNLSDLQIDPAHLKPFIPETSILAGLIAEELQGSSVERFPLFEQDGELVVSSPALLCRAGAMLAIEAAKALGRWVDTFFEIESAQYFLNEIISPLGIKPVRGITLPTPPPNLPPLYPSIGQFDYGMPVLALTQSSAVTSEDSLEDFERLSDEQISQFSQYLSDCCQILERIESFKGGMILVALSGVGRSMGVVVEDLRPKWQIYTASLADWLTLATESEFDARRLWYFSLQEEMARNAGVEILNMAGLLNLYGFWRAREFTFIPADMDLKNSRKLLSVEGSFSQIINAEFKNVSDRHCRWHPVESRSFEVQREGTGLNPDISKNLRYADHESARNRLLRGCIVNEAHAWWIEVSKKTAANGSIDLIYRLWDCVTSWCERLMLHLSREHPTWIPAEIVIHLDLPGVDKWNLENVRRDTPHTGACQCQLDESKGLILLTIGEPFLTNFFRAKNTAEWMIVTELVDKLVDKGTAEDRRQIVLNTLRNEDTRFFHIVQTHDLENILGLGRAEPLLVPDEEFWRASIGLAYTVSESPPPEITDSKEATRFLGKVVANLQSSISEDLRKFAIQPVVSHAFSQLDELSRDTFRWNLSMRALLALEDKAKWLTEHLRMASSRNKKAEITNRILIESASYSCIASERKEPSHTELLSILAQISVMVQLAEYRDALSNGLVEAHLIVHPNGQIEYNDSFREEVMQPYLTSRVDDGIHHHAELYDDNFDELPTREPKDEESRRDLERFESSFAAEYGFGLDSLNRIVEVFRNFAIKTKQAHGIIPESLLIQILKNGVGFSKEQIANFIEKFVLPIRTSWDKELPKGCELNDVFPWRFFRGLSVLVRPIVEVSKSPREFAISATHLERWRTYLVRSICNGELPDRIFESSEMKSYLGAIAQKDGIEFEKIVTQELVKLGLKARQGVKIRELGKNDADPSDDVDVIAWDQSSKCVFMVECKNLKRALTVAQAIQQLEDFRGDPDNQKDYLTKHLNRVLWLRENPARVSQITGIPRNKIRWKALLITSGRVPMSYRDSINLKKEDVWPFAEIEEKLKLHIG